MTILDLQWKKAKLFYFSKWQIPHTRAKQDTLRGYQAFYSMHNAFIEMKMTLHLMTNTILEGKGTLCGFGNILEEQ